MVTVIHSDIDAVVATQVAAEDLASLEGDGYRYDLLAGDLIRVSPAGFRHGRLAHEISGRLWVFLHAHSELQLVAVGAETGFRWITVTGKVDAYLAAGVRVVWVIEPGARAARVYTSE